jgi:hypothetical protein
LKDMLFDFHSSLLSSWKASTGNVSRTIFE